MTNRIVTASVVAIAGVALASAAAGPAFAATPTPTPTASPAPSASPTPAAKPSRTLAQIQASAVTAASKRNTALTTAIADVTNNTTLSPADKSRLLAILNSDKTIVAAQASKVAADTTTTSATTDLTAMFTDARVFAVALPQARIAAGADRLTTSTLPKLNVIETKLAADLHGQDSNKSTPTLEAELSDMSKQLDAAKDASAGLAARAVAVTPGDFNSSHDVLKPLDSDLKSARSDVKKAVSDAKDIRAAVSNRV